MLKGFQSNPIMTATADRFSSITDRLPSQSILAIMKRNEKKQVQMLELMDLYTRQGKSIYSGAYIDARITLDSYAESWHKMYQILVGRGYDPDEIRLATSI